MSARRWTMGAGVLALGVMATATGCGARGSLTVAGTSSGTPAAPPPCQPGDPPVALVTGEDGPVAIALDADAVYYSTGSTMSCAPEPRVKRVPKRGGAPTVVGRSMYPLPAIAVDAESVYWTDDPVSPCTDPVDEGFTVVSTPKAGGMPLSFPFAAQLQPAFDMALDETFVYWLTQQGSSVLLTPKGGGSTEAISSEGMFQFGLALDEASVYWTNENLGVLRAPKAPGAMPVTLAPLATGDGVLGIAVDGGDVYFTGSTTCPGPCDSVATLKRVPAGGGGVTTLGTLEDTAFPDLALGPTSVYVTAPDVQKMVGASPTGSVLRIPRSGGPPEVIAKARLPARIAVDEACVYWTDSADGSVWRAPL